MYIERRDSPDNESSDGQASSSEKVVELENVIASLEKKVVSLTKFSRAQMEKIDQIGRRLAQLENEARKSVVKPVRFFAKYF